MNRCPITYEECGSQLYSEEGLKLLSKRLKQLKMFGFTAEEQIEMAAMRASKMSIQGVQPKLSVKLNVGKEAFEVVERWGNYILKPPHSAYPELPQNEDLTMKLASIVGIHVPAHGMIYNIDGTLTYFIKRFDRLPKKVQVRCEDFGQLLGFSRETKYESSMEKVASVVDDYCTFKILEKIKLFRRVLFNFLVGNEDMHLKNFSLIEGEKGVELAPAYDLLNTTIAINAKEEIALPIRGKKSNLNRKDLVDYYAIERLGLTNSMVQKELSKFESSKNAWFDLIHKSFLTPKRQKQYKDLIEDRYRRVFEKGGRVPPLER